MEKYSDAQKKYEKLKNKGKLSPVDEEKWLKKLENLKENLEKNRKRANRYLASEVLVSLTSLFVYPCQSNMDVS